MQKDRLFIGLFPAGVVYADCGVETDGDYARLGFLSYHTLELRVCESCPPAMRARIERHAATIQARRGEQFEVSACGQTVRLGGEYTARDKLDDLALCHSWRSDGGYTL